LHLGNLTTLPSASLHPEALIEDFPRQLDCVFTLSSFVVDSFTQPTFSGWNRLPSVFKVLVFILTAAISACLTHFITELTAAGIEV
jgi:hypothetical protein